MIKTENNRFHVDYSDLELTDGFYKNNRIQFLVSVKKVPPMKSVVVCVYSSNLESLLKANPVWHKSRILDAAFQYLSPEKAAGLVSFEVIGLKKGDYISVEPWNVKGDFSIFDLVNGIYQKGTIGSLNVIKRLV